MCTTKNSGQISSGTPHNLRFSDVFITSTNTASTGNPSFPAGPRASAGDIGTVIVNSKRVQQKRSDVPEILKRPQPTAERVNKQREFNKKGIKRATKQTMDNEVDSPCS